MKIKKITHFAVALSAASLMTIGSTGCAGSEGAMGQLAGYGYALMGGTKVDPYTSVIIGSLVGYAAEHVQVTSVKKSDTSNGYSVLATVDGQEYECHLESLISATKSDSCKKINQPNKK